MIVLFLATVDPIPIHYLYDLMIYFLTVYVMFFLHTVIPCHGHLSAKSGRRPARGTAFGPGGTEMQVTMIGKQSATHQL